MLTWSLSSGLSIPGRDLETSSQGTPQLWATPRPNFSKWTPVLSNLTFDPSSPSPPVRQMSRCKTAKSSGFFFVLILLHVPPL